MAKSAKRGNNNGSGFPALVQVQGEKKPRVVKNLKELEAIGGSFRVVQRNYRPNGGKQPARVVGNSDQLSIPAEIKFAGNTWVKEVDALIIEKAVPSPDKPDTHTHLILADFPDHPVEVTNDWWEKNKPRKNPNQQSVLIDHRNGFYTATPLFLHKLNFKEAPKPEAERAEPKPAKKQDKKPQETALAEAAAETEKLNEPVEVKSEKKEEILLPLDNSTRDEGANLIHIAGTDVFPDIIGEGETEHAAIEDLVKKIGESVGDDGKFSTTINVAEAAKADGENGDCFSISGKAVEAIKKAIVDYTETQRASQVLIGTDLLPAMVELAPGVEVQLGDVVGRAFENTGVSPVDWNNMEGQVRDAHIMAALEQMKREAAAAGEPA